jgi:tetratricopeptide (TPR) repeat protein
MVQQILKLDLDPAETYDARVLIAVAYHAAGDLERAEQTYRQAIDAYPKRPEAHANLADLLVRQNRLDEAIEEYHLTADLQPDAASAVYERIGDLLSERGRHDEALDALYTAVKRDPTNAEAYYSLGWVHEQRDELGQAIAMYTQAIDISFKYEAAYIALGRVYAKQGDVESLERMIQQMRGLIITEAERYDACLVFAEVYQAAGERERQEQAYREAIALDPERAEAYTNLAQFLADQEKLDEAIQVCMQMAQQPQLRYSAQVSLGNLLAAQGKHDEARSAYRQAIETGTHLPAAG